ncbi:MAG: low molecular weight protein-tyrosine-phosphatase [Opitutales bacterium]|jgi:protein-tyrosine phosphatase
MNSNISVLFVCMGNICRSPAAEAVFKEKVKSSGHSERIACDSAGTIGYHAGSPADSRMRAAGSRRGYHLDSISRQVRPEDLERFDHIIAMDHDNMENLRSMGNVSDGKARLSLMCDYARNHDDRVVPDPYYGGDRGFEHVMDLLEDACQGLLEELTRPKA